MMTFHSHNSFRILSKFWLSKWNWHSKGQVLLLDNFRVILYLWHFKNRLYSRNIWIRILKPQSSENSGIRTSRYFYFQYLAITIHTYIFWKLKFEYWKCYFCFLFYRLLLLYWRESIDNNLSFTNPSNINMIALQFSSKVYNKKMHKHFRRLIR